MTESDFRIHLQKGLQSQGAFVLKVPDLARAIVKPCDMVVGLNRQLLLVECKLRKIAAKKGITRSTVVVSRGDFRPHQLPTLLDASAKKQAISKVAACLAQESMGRVVERRAWLFPAELYRDENRDALTVGFLEDNCSELNWVPKVGWIAPWLSEPTLD